MPLLLDLPIDTKEKSIVMTYAEFLDRSDEDLHAEWVNGEAIFFMPSTPSHQNVVSFLVALLCLYIDYFRLGQLLPGPVEMKPLPDASSRVPDLLFVATEHLSYITDSQLGWYTLGGLMGLQSLYLMNTQMKDTSVLDRLLGLDIEL